MWNFPKPTEGISVKAGIRARKHICEKKNKKKPKKTRLELFLTQICCKNSPSTQQEALNVFISLQSGAQMVQQDCHKITLMHFADQVVVVSLCM